MKNLLDETLEFFNENKILVSDIVFIGTYDGKYSCNWYEFKLLADRNYHNGYGSQEVLPELVIVFKNSSWMSRDEYDGAEEWRLNEKPFETLNSKTLKTLFPEEED